MTRTTADWEALLDGTTPAPWEALQEDDHTPVWTVGGLGDTPARIVGDVYGESNARMIASAPEAVAEVVRLRRELARLVEFIAGYPLQQVLVASPTNGQRALDMQAKSVAIIKHIIAEDMEPTYE